MSMMMSSGMRPQTTCFASISPTPRAEVSEPQVNVTHSSSIIDLAFGDFRGNGQDVMVSIRASGKVSVDLFSNRTNVFKP